MAQQQLTDEAQNLALLWSAGQMDRGECQECTLQSQ